ncbi:ATP-binding protein [Corynebacterium sp. USCH3]|uniref:ATP-binding protein n=1 Tax=Corynebacterium sp. USCH3 TaxID=3024840 RepID=UPI0030B0E2D5
MRKEEPVPRFQSAAVEEALSDTPVVVVHGARQVGKSTLVAELGARCREPVLTVTFDDPETLEFARLDPTGFVEQAGSGTLIIDEVQRVPEIMLPLKANVDRDRRPGRFLLTGSADVFRVRGIGDSLAGRVESVRLMPFSQGERARREVPEDFVAALFRRPAVADLSRVLGEGGTAIGGPLSPDVALAGGFPEATVRTPRRRNAWFRTYIRRLADHDAYEYRGGGFPDEMERLTRLLAAGGATEIVQSRLAAHLGTSDSTMATYLRTLRTMNLLVEVPSWTRPVRGRTVRRPKAALTDTGLSASLGRLTQENLQKPGMREFYGAVVEQLVMLELLKQQGWSAEEFEIYHYRDNDDLEVDLVIDLLDGRLVAIEVKSGQTVKTDAFKKLERFRDKVSDHEVIGVVLHGGRGVQLLHGWIYVLPVQALWTLD